MLDVDQTEEKNNSNGTLLSRHRVAVLLIAIGIAGFSASQFVDELKQVQGGVASLFAGAIGVIQWLISKDKREQKETFRETTSVLDDTFRLNLRLVTDALTGLRSDLVEKHSENQRNFAEIIENNKRYDQLHESHAAEIASLKEGQRTLENSQAEMRGTLGDINRDIGRIMGKMGLDGHRENEIIPLRPEDGSNEPGATPADTA
jgi:hypothetical protein